MDIREVKTPFKVINKFEGRVVSGAFSLGHEETRTVNPSLVPKSLLEDLNIFHNRGQVEFDLNVKLEKELAKDGNVREVNTVKNEDGETHDHFVYDPNANKAIVVETIEDNNKAINVGYSKTDAVEFLEKHWKTIEKELEKITDETRLGFLLSVATELEMTGNKKFELIKNRLNAIK